MELNTPFRSLPFSLFVTHPPPEQPQPSGGMTERNRKVLLASRPQGAVTEQNFRIVDAPLPEPAAGEVLVKNEWLSLDPYMRGRMSDAKSYVPPAQLDCVMVGQTVGEVIDSRDPTIDVGDKVLTQLGWQSHIRDNPHLESCQYGRHPIRRACFGRLQKYHGPREVKRHRWGSGESGRCNV